MRFEQPRAWPITAFPSLLRLWPVGGASASLTADLGVRNVHFAGSLDEPGEVASALHQHDLLIAPSVRTSDGDMDESQLSF